MKERGIIFSAPMVRAILAGRKTMTRRIVSHVAGLGKVTCFDGSETTGYDFALRDRRDMWHEFREDELLARCPYGPTGSPLWVREAFLPCTHPKVVKTNAATYACFFDGSQKFKSGEYFQDSKDPSACVWPSNARWKPSIHMPRWASRITLQVEAVRVERLQDITVADALAEGVGDFATANNLGGYWTTAFARLWEKINGEGSWDANPFVWCVSFSVVKP